MLTITNEAADAIKEAVQAQAMPEGSGLRITAEEDDEGASFELELTDGPEDEDDVVETGGARVFLDETASDVLANSELTVTPHGDHVHFDFADRGSA